MQCTKCGGRATVYLCRECIRELDSNLEQVPWIADRLTEAYAKENALSTPPGPRRIVEAEDDEQSPIPFDASAGDTYDELRTTLMRWCRDLADQIGVEWLPVDAVPLDFIGPLRPMIPARNTERIPEIPGQFRISRHYIPDIADLSRWLNVHRLDLANSEDAAFAAHEIDRVCRKAFRVLNPPKRVYCGPCPTVVGKDARNRPLECAQGLWADWDDDNDHAATHVECWKCRKRHNVDELKKHIYAHADHFSMTVEELLSVLDNLGEPVPQSTLYRWIKEGRVRPRGYQRDGRITPTRLRRGDPAVFSLAEVRGLMARDEQRRKETVS